MEPQAKRTPRLHLVNLDSVPLTDDQKATVEGLTADYVRLYHDDRESLRNMLSDVIQTVAINFSAGYDSIAGHFALDSIAMQRALDSLK